MLCTWDRHSLAAKAAAALSAVGLKIVQADICTRADHIVLALGLCAARIQRRAESGGAGDQF